MRPKIRALLFWLNIVFAGAMILLYLGPYIDPRHLWGFTLIGLAYPYLLVVNVGFIILWIIFWKKYSFISLGVLFLGIAHLDRFYGIDLSKDWAIEPQDINIMSFNVQDLREVNLEGEEYFEVVRQIQKQDIVLLQEMSNHKIGELTRYLPHYEIFKPAGLALCILSKLPIKDKGIVSRENASNGSIWVDIDHNDRLIRIYNVHLQSYRVKKTTTEIIDNAKFGNEKTWTDVRSVFSKIRDMSIKRSEQVDYISLHRNGTTLPTIIGGDFNDTPVSNTYRRLSQGFVDSFRVKGEGIGTTYAGRIPLLRIDYIFAGAGFKVVDHEVVQSSISDHYPIKSVIRLQPD